MLDQEEKMEQWRQSIIEQIVQARTTQGFTQAQLEEMPGTHRSNISPLESGVHDPSLDFLLKVSAALHMELDLVPLEKEVTVAMENHYELRLFDTTLLEFVLEQRGVSLTARIISVDEKNEHLLPLYLHRTDEGVLAWLRHRVMPKNRTFVQRPIIK